MSGGGGGGGGRGGEGGPTPCDQIQFETALQSPDPDALAILGKGDVLDIAIQERTVVAISQAGARVGSIIMQVEDLLRCIAAGTQYRAQVLSIDDGLVRVHVESTT